MCQKLVGRETRQKSTVFSESPVVGLQSCAAQELLTMYLRYCSLVVTHPSWSHRSYPSRSQASAFSNARDSNSASCVSTSPPSVPQLFRSLFRGISLDTLSPHVDDRLGRQDGWKSRCPFSPSRLICCPSYPFALMPTPCVSEPAIAHAPFSCTAQNRAWHPGSRRIPTRQHLLAVGVSVVHCRSSDSSPRAHRRTCEGRKLQHFWW